MHPLIIMHSNIDASQLQKISMWRRVVLVDLALQFPSKSTEFMFNRQMKMAAFKYITDFCPRFLVLQPGYVFKNNAADRLKALTSEKQPIAWMSERNIDFYDAPAILLAAEFYDLFIFKAWECCHSRPEICDSLKARQNKTLAVNELDNILLSKVKPRAAFDCNILLREDAFFVDNSKIPVFNFSTTPKSKICFGMPTRSTSHISTFKKIAPLRIFLKPFLDSVLASEWETFEYAILLGYDDDDAQFSVDETRLQILEEMQNQIGSRPVIVVPIAFPKSGGWVTFIWNGLFDYAVQMDCDYFYQINDDVEISGEPGWSSNFVDALRKVDNIGVVGAKDFKRKRKLLTQAMVHRTHHRIFHRMFPLGMLVLNNRP